MLGKVLNVVVRLSALKEKKKKPKPETGSEDHRNLERSGTEDQILNGKVQNQKKHVGQFKAQNLVLGFERPGNGRGQKSVVHQRTVCEIKSTRL